MLSLQNYALTMCFIVICNCSVFGQSAFSAYAGARVLGMAGCGTAITGGDALFSNLAGASVLTGPVAALTAENRFALQELTRAEVAMLMPFRFGSTAAGWSRQGTGFNTQQSCWLGAIRTLNSSMALSVKAIFLMHNAEGHAPWTALTGALGWQALINRNLRLGVHIFHPAGILHADTQTESRLRVGVQYRVSDLVHLHAEIDKPAWRPWAIRAGLSYACCKNCELTAGTAPTLGIFSVGFTGKHLKNLTYTISATRHQNLGIIYSVTFVQSFLNKSPVENSDSDTPLSLSARKGG